MIYFDMLMTDILQQFDSIFDLTYQSLLIFKLIIGIFIILSKIKKHFFNKLKKYDLLYLLKKIYRNI